MVQNIDNQDDGLELVGDDYGRAVINWRIHEYPFYERNRRWYIVFAVIVVLMLCLALIPSTFLPDFLSQMPVLRNFFFGAADYTFAVVIILITAVVIINGQARPSEVDFIVTTEGFIIGQQFYDYDRFREFSIIFKPAENLKVLYLEYKNTFMPRLSVQLNDADPLAVREALLPYLEEDLVRTDESNSDYFSRVFKL